MGHGASGRGDGPGRRAGRSGRRRSRPGEARSTRAGVDHGPDHSLGRLEAEERDRPGQAGPLPWREVGVRGKLGDQIERAAAEAGVADLGGQVNTETTVTVEGKPFASSVQTLTSFTKG